MRLPSLFSERGLLFSCSVTILVSWGLLGYLDCALLDCLSAWRSMYAEGYPTGLRVAKDQSAVQGQKVANIAYRATCYTLTLYITQQEPNCISEEYACAIAQRGWF